MYIRKYIREHKPGHFQRITIPVKYRRPSIKQEKTDEQVADGE